MSGLFANAQERATVYTRTEALWRSGRLVGFAYNALKEAYYSEQARSLLLVEYDLLAQRPGTVMSLIYQFLEEEPFKHDFEKVEYEEEEFDFRLKTPGLHRVQRKVEYIPRATILPPDLFAHFEHLSFWQESTRSEANIIMAQPQEPQQVPEPFKTSQPDGRIRVSI